MMNSPQPAPRPITQMTIGCVVIPILVLIFLLVAFFVVRAGASDQIVIPAQTVALVRAEPDEAALLLARFGEGQTLQVTGRSEDWHWLEVETWPGQRGWTLRPLDLLVWQIEANPVAVTPVSQLPANPTPVAEEMLPIPATTFTQGSPPGIGEEDERPAQPVTLSSYAIDKTEVTVGQYWRCVAATACAPPQFSAGQPKPHYLNNPAYDNYPVVNVPWSEASRYCLWQGKRLPTEAEWERAAGWDDRNKAKFMWPWGNDPSQAKANVGPTSLGAPAIAGTIEDDISPVEVLDMGGNVSEWVSDWYKVDYYGVTGVSNPTGPTYRRGEGTGKVVRGGAYTDSDMQQARTANRRHQAESYGYPTIGFRCVVD